MPIGNAGDEVLAVQGELGNAIMRKDLDRAVLFMTADVTLLGPMGPAAIGHEAVRRLYADLFNRFNITVSNADCTVDVLGEAQ